MTTENRWLLCEPRPRFSRPRPLDGAASIFPFNPLSFDSFERVAVFSEPLPAAAPVFWTVG
jgi:hypothetical protein